MSKVLLIDNFDSFVYNIARYVCQLGFQCEVFRNNELAIEDIIQYDPSHIIISPGPCTPDEAGISLSIVKELYQKFPILGICLGHQVIGQVFNAKILRALRPMHGRASLISHNQSGLFQGIENPIEVGRYHSLIVNENNLSKSMNVDARSAEGEVMAISHQCYPLYGVQFHPESVLTKCGYKLLINFLNSKQDDIPELIYEARERFEEQL
jgi:para-aminobenzoate synthetase component 2